MTFISCDQKKGVETTYMEYANIKCLGKKTIENPSPIHQIHTSAMIKNINLKVDHQTGWPQTPPK